MTRSKVKVTNQSKGVDRQSCTGLIFFYSFNSGIVWKICNPFFNQKELSENCFIARQSVKQKNWNLFFCVFFTFRFRPQGVMQGPAAIYQRSHMIPVSLDLIEAALRTLANDVAVVSECCCVAGHWQPELAGAYDEWSGDKHGLCRTYQRVHGNWQWGITHDLFCSQFTEALLFSVEMC